jgi:hypothetical protein
MQYPRQPPLLYYDISQKSPLFLSVAVVGESPHGLEGSCIYLSPIYSKYDIHGITVDIQCRVCVGGRGAVRGCIFSQLLNALRLYKSWRPFSLSNLCREEKF